MTFESNNISDANINKIKNLDNQKMLLTEEIDMLQNKAIELEAKKSELEKKLEEKSFISSELEQQKMILSEMHKSLDGKSEELEKLSKQLEKKLEEKSFISSELEQQKMILSEMMKAETKTKHILQKKSYNVVILASIIIASITIGFFYYESVRNIETEQVLVDAIKVKEPLIQNLQGETIDTWISWNKKDGDVLYVNIENAKDFPKDKIEAVKNAILSFESATNEDSMTKESSSLLYKGWNGALEKAAEVETALYIPTKIEMIESKGKGDITIELTNKKDDDGYSGFTKSIVNQNKILMSRITLYEVGTLTNEKLASLVRHEFGHALGLAHSTAPEDLMAPVIKTKHPYITECDINAITELYNNKQKSRVECV